MKPSKPTRPSLPDHIDVAGVRFPLVWKKAAWSEWTIVMGTRVGIDRADMPGSSVSPATKWFGFRHDPVKYGPSGTKSQALWWALTQARRVLRKLSVRPVPKARRK